MPIVVTGATGSFGSHVVSDLLDRGVPPEEVVAGGRNEERLAALADRGVRTARMDYDEPATLEPALDEGDRLLLVSGSELGHRIAQHRNVIEVAGSWYLETPASRWSGPAWVIGHLCGRPR